MARRAARRMEGSFDFRSLTQTDSGCPSETGSLSSPAHANDRHRTEVRNTNVRGTNRRCAVDMGCFPQEEGDFGPGSTSDSVFYQGLLGLEAGSASMWRNASVAKPWSHSAPISAAASSFKKAKNFVM